MRQRRKPKTITANQLIAGNLRRARQMRGLTQEQAAELLEPYLGKRWSKATFSAAETSATGDRVREFTANEILAFARALRVPLFYFFTPADPDTSITSGGPQAVKAPELVDFLLARQLVEDLRDRIERALTEGLDPLTRALMADEIDEAVKAAMDKLTETHKRKEEGDGS